MNEIQHRPTLEEIGSEATRIHETVVWIFGGMDYGTTIEFNDMEKNIYRVRRSKSIRTWLENSDMNTDNIFASIAPPVGQNGTIKGMDIKFAESDKSNPSIFFGITTTEWDESENGRHVVNGVESDLIEIDTRVALEESAKFTLELLSLVPRTYPPLNS